MPTRDLDIRRVAWRERPSQLMSGCAGTHVSLLERLCSRGQAERGGGEAVGGCRAILGNIGPLVCIPMGGKTSGCGLAVECPRSVGKYARIWWWPGIEIWLQSHLSRVCKDCNRKKGKGDSQGGPAVGED